MFHDVRIAKDFSGQTSKSLGKHNKNRQMGLYWIKIFPTTKEVEWSNNLLEKILANHIYDKVNSV